MWHFLFIYSFLRLFDLTEFKVCEMKDLRLRTSKCKNIGIKTLEFVVKTQFLTFSTCFMHFKQFLEKFKHLKFFFSILKKFQRILKHELYSIFL